MRFKAPSKSGCILLNGAEFPIENGVVEVPGRYEKIVEPLGYQRIIGPGDILFPPSPVKVIDPNKKQLDLVIVLPHTITGGSEMRLLQTIRYLPNYRIHIMYIKNVKDGGVVEKFAKEPNVIGTYYTPRAKKIRNYSINNDVDIMLFYGSAMPMEAFYNRIRPISILSLNTDTWEHSIKFAELCKDHIDAIVTVSPHIIGLCGGRYKKLRCILNGADHKRFLPAKKARNDGVVRVGYVGRLLRHKGPELIPAALAGLKNVELYIAGSRVTGPEGYDNIPKLCKKYKVPLKFYGLVDRPEDVYRKLDILVLMSDKEGMPMMVIEGSLSKNAIISTRIGGLPKVYTHGKNIIFCKKDSASLKAAIRDLVDNPDKLEMLKEGAYNLARTRMTMERAASDYRAMFKELIRSGRKNVSQIGVYRCGGGGDIIMSEPAVRKLRELYPGSKIIYECAPEFKDVVRAFGWEYGKVGVAPRRVIFKYDKSTKHAISQYMSQVGGRFKNNVDNYPRFYKRFKDRGERDVAIITTSHCGKKNWSRSNWEKLITMIVDQYGIEVHQIDDGVVIPGATLVRSTSLKQFINLIPEYKVIITIDTLGSHIAAASRTRAVVLWGKASSPDLTGYPFQRNIVSPFKCRCWFSVNQDLYRKKNCPGNCIDQIKPVTVYNAFEDELRKAKNGQERKIKSA